MKGVPYFLLSQELLETGRAWQHDGPIPTIATAGAGRLLGLGLLAQQRIRSKRDCNHTQEEKHNTMPAYPEQIQRNENYLQAFYA